MRQQRRLSPESLPPDLDAQGLAAWLSDRIADSVAYMQWRKRVFSQSATALRLTVLAMSGAATVILGLQDLGTWAEIAFALVALGTVLQGLEEYFNWRSRWILAESTMAEFFALQDDLGFAVASAAPAAIAAGEVKQLFVRYQQVWKQFSEAWVSERRRTHAR